MVSDFTYFGEIYATDEVDDLVAYALLAFALCGLVVMLVGPPTRCGHASGVILEDIPMIIATTAIEAYIVGANVTEWSTEGVVSYIFSLFALQQKLMYLGYAPVRRGQVRNEGEKPGVFDVLLFSFFVAGAALAVAWIVAAFIILVI